MPHYFIHFSYIAIKSSRIYQNTREPEKQAGRRHVHFHFWFSIDITVLLSSYIHSKTSVTAAFKHTKKPHCTKQRS